MVNIIEEIKKSMRELQCFPDIVGLGYEDLCSHPNLNLLEGFKILTFDTFGGVGKPMAHLRAYYDHLIVVC